ELALLSGALRRLRGGARVGVIAEREVAIDEVNAIAVRVQHLRDGRIRALAERALEIRELDDFNWGAPRSFGRAVRRGDRLTRRFDQDAHRRLRLQRREKLLLRELHPLLRQVRANRVAHLIEWPALDARLVRLIPLRDLDIADRCDLRGD